MGICDRITVLDHGETHRRGHAREVRATQGHRGLPGEAAGEPMTTEPHRHGDGASRDGAARAADVHTYYGKIHALQGISLEVRRGEIVTLIGANGAGKTTTLKTICGLLHPRQGHGALRRPRRRATRRPTGSCATGIGARPRGPPHLLAADGAARTSRWAATRRTARRHRRGRRARLQPLPAPRRTRRPERRDAVRRRAADAGHRPGADDAGPRSSCSTSRRWASRRSWSSRSSRSSARSMRRAPPSCSSSRTRSRRWRWPTAATCSRRAG